MLAGVHVQAAIKHRHISNTSLLVKPETFCQSIHTASARFRQRASTSDRALPNLS